MAKKIESEVLEDEVLDEVEEPENEVSEDEAEEFEDDAELKAAVAGGAVGTGLGFTLGFTLGRKVEKAKAKLKGEAEDGGAKPEKEKRSLNPFKGLKFQSPIVRKTEETQPSEPDANPKPEDNANKKKSKK